MRLTRKGTVELPATAIFTIAAGSLIVLFFVVLSQNQAEGAQGETEARTLNFLDTLIKTSATARDTQTNITVVDDDLLFTCDEEGMRFGFESENSLPLFDLVVFSPRTLTGGAINAYSRGEDVPFRAFNILYLTTPQYIVQDGIGSLDLPPDIQRVPLTPGATGQKGKRAILTASDLSTKYTTTTPIPSDLIVINSPTTDYSYGSATYVLGGRAVDNQNVPNTIIFPTKNMLTGAILSRNKDTYNCVFNAYLKQLRYVAQLQRDRSQALKDESFASSSSCYSLYQLSAFDTIINLPDAEQFTAQDAQDYRDSVRELDFVNDNLLRGDNCVSLF